MFGKIMSIPDEAMWEYHRLLLLTDEGEIERLKAEHPMAVKKQLARELTSCFHTEEDASTELAQFEKVFSKRENPDNMPTFQWEQLSPDAEVASLVDVMAATSLFNSKGEIRRLIAQGGVKINDEKQTETLHKISQPTTAMVIRAGKRKFFQISP